MHDHVPAGRTLVSRRTLLRNAGIGAGALALSAAAPAGALEALTGRAAAAAGAGSASAALQLARVFVTRDTAHLLNGFDDTHRVFGDGSIEVLLWPGDLARLQATGLPFQITVTDLVARDRARDASASTERTVAVQPGETPDGQYRQLADYEADMRRLASENPTLVKLIALPFKTLERRTVYGLEICENVDRYDGRPVFYNDGVHHAREWPAAEVPIMWAFDLVEGYKAGDARIVNIVRNVRNIVVPVVNPDGFHWSREFPVETGVHQAGQSLPVLGGDGPEALVLGGQGQYWRKNRRQLVDHNVGPGLVHDGREVPDGVTAHGVDPNRNYASHWGDNQGGSGSDLFAQNYRGEVPFSESEARNVGWLHQTQHILAMITHHTSGDLVLWAWGDTRDDAPDNTLLEGLGRACATFNGYVPQKSIDLYITTGTCSDYTYGSFGSIGYTFEHAGDAFHPAYAATIPAMYAKNREALLLLCEEVCLEPHQRDANRSLPAVIDEVFSGQTGAPYNRAGLHHAIITGRLVDAAGNGVAGEVRLTKSFQTPLWRDGNGANPAGIASITETLETVMQTGSDGTFRYHVYPSTRPKIEFEGETEAYRGTFLAAGRGAVREFVVRRGEVLDLSDVIVA